MAGNPDRPRRTTRELVDASEHVFYEAQMLVGMAGTLAIGITADSLLHNAVLESFVIHARGLLHFFFPEGRVAVSDVLAADYFDHADQWEAVRGDLPAALKDVRRRVNKETAHITYNRLEIVGEARRWPHATIRDEIVRLVRAFVENVDTDRLHANWKKIPWHAMEV